MVADEHEKRTNQQWTIPLLRYIVGEMAIEVLKGVKDIDDKASIAQGFATLKMDTLAGPIDFSAPVVDENSLRLVPNIYKTPLTLGQWRKGEKWPFDLILVNNAAAPMVTIQDKAAYSTQTDR